METQWHIKFGNFEFGNERTKPVPPPKPLPVPPPPPRPPRPDWRHHGPRPLRDGADEVWTTIVEDLAQALHESGREAVEQGLTLAAANGCENRTFVEWNDLPEVAKEGRRVQARWLLDCCGIEAE